MGMQNQILLSIYLLFAAVILLWTGLERELRQRRLQKRRLQYQREAVLGKKSSRIERHVVSERNLVKATNTDRNTYIALMAASVVGGWLFGKMVFMDTAVSICIAIVCIVLPHAYLIIKSNNSKRELAENLESAMRIITHEYMSTLDLQKAVENAVDVIDHDKPFRQFLVDCKLVSSNMERNLRRLEGKENNVFLSRWVDQLILVQNDRNQIVNLMPILDDMNDAKTAQRQNDTKVAGAWRDYFTLLFIILLSPLLIRVIQYEWYAYLINTLIGRGLIVVMLACLVWATGRAMKINQPITG